MNYGFIYCLGNRAMPGIYKVGMTERSPLQRCDELSNSTSSPLPFELLCFGQVTNARAAEAEIHSGLSASRVNQSREFFHGPFGAISDVIRDYSNGFAMTDEGDEEEEKERLHGLFSCASPEARVHALNEAAKFSGIHLYQKDGQLWYRGRANTTGWLYGAIISMRRELLEFVPVHEPEEAAPAAEASEPQKEELDW